MAVRPAGNSPQGTKACGGLGVGRGLWVAGAPGTRPGARPRLMGGPGGVAKARRGRGVRGAEDSGGAGPGPGRGRGVRGGRRAGRGRGRRRGRGVGGGRLGRGGAGRGQARGGRSGRCPDSNSGPQGPPVGSECVGGALAPTWNLSSGTTSWSASACSSGKAPSTATAISVRCSLRRRRSAVSVPARASPVIVEPGARVWGLLLPVVGCLGRVCLLVLALPQPQAPGRAHLSRYLGRHLRGAERCYTRLPTHRAKAAPPQSQSGPGGFQRGRIRNFPVTGPPPAPHPHLPAGCWLGFVKEASRTALPVPSLMWASTHKSKATACHI